MQSLHGAILHSATPPIGAVPVTGAKAPRLVSKELLSRMHKGSVIVDVSVDQGGRIETTRPSTHNNPVYTVDGVIHSLMCEYKIILYYTQITCIVYLQ